jgi:UDP-glucose 4-epimerase
VTEEARRAGDPAVLVAASTKIKKELGWKPAHSTIAEIISTAWQWHQAHPQGYEA